MDLTTITAADFKAQFPRDFPYLPTWVAGTYNTGNQVYYAITLLFYEANSDGVVSTPDTSADWKKINSDISNYIQDSDIERAFLGAQMNFNQSLYGTDTQIELVYLYLTAHYLVHDFKQWSSGLESVGEGPVSSRSAGNVSEGYTIPKAWTDSVILNFYTTSSYGLKFLSFTTNRIVGNITPVRGATTA